MAKSHYPASNSTPEGQRLKGIITRLIADWNDLATERSIMIQKKDLIGVKNVTGAVTSGGLIKLTVTAHGLSTGAQVFVKAVGGVPNANGTWIITVVDANSFTLQGSVFTGTYTSGGTVENSVVYQTIGDDYFLGTDANAKAANANGGFAEIDSAFNIGDAAIRQMSARVM